MSAWKKLKGSKEAPKDGTQILVRHGEWDCPAVVYWDADGNEWVFAEMLLVEIGDVAIDADTLKGAEWTLIPK